MQIDKDRRIW